MESKNVFKTNLIGETNLIGCGFDVIWIFLKCKIRRGLPENQAQCESSNTPPLKKIQELFRNLQTDIRAHVSAINPARKITEGGGRFL